MEDARLPLNDGPPSADLVADADRALMLRAAWHYFIEERTQADIADMLGVTRFRVNRMLAECRAEGHVRVEITAPLASCVAESGSWWRRSDLGTPSWCRARSIRSAPTR